ncbi:MAG: hypothetical protein AB7N71_00230 [Phycisphaerae bacterium]
MNMAQELNSTFSLPRVAILLVGTWSVATASAASASAPREIIARANMQYEQGNFADALETYQTVAETQPDELRAIALHNEAAAHYRLGDIAAAKDAWVKALHYNDAAFESRVRYNLGNCNYREALDALATQDPQAAGGAIPALGKAIEQYRDAIRLDSQNTNARANLELAFQLKKQLEEQAEQQQQDSQRDESQDGEQEQQDSQRGKPDSSDPSQQQQEQNDSSQQNQQQSDQQQQQDPQSSSQQGQQSSSQQQSGSQNEQRKSDEEKSEEQGDPGKPETQPQTSGDEECELEQPKEGGDKPSEMPKPAPQSATPEEGTGQDPSEGIMLTEEEAKTLLQTVRDNEKKRREALRVRLRAQHQPVKQDW